jgi:hypothetical protein
MYSPDPELVDNPMVVVEDPAMLPAYTYAEANPLRLGDFDGRRPSAVRARLTSGVRQAVMAFERLGRTTPGSASSRRMVGSWGASLTSSRLTSVTAFTKKYSVQPLVAITFAPGADGWQLESVKLSLFVPKQLTVYRAAAAPQAPALAAPQPAAPANPAPAAAAAGASAASAPLARTQLRPTRPLPPVPQRNGSAPPPPVAGN